MIRKLIACSLLIGAIPAGFFLASLFSRAAPDVARVTAQDDRHLTVQQLRDFPDFPVFWLGERFQGMSPTNIQYRSDPGDGIKPPVEQVVVTYGDCDAEPGSGCPAPLAVFTSRPCLNMPSQLAEGVRQGPPVRIRRTLAQWGQPGHLFLYTGGSTIQIASSIGDDIALEAADALAGVNPPGLTHAPERSVPLPPPVDEGECIL